MDFTIILIGIGLLVTGGFITYPFAYRRGQMQQLGLLKGFGCEPENHKVNGGK